MKEAIDKVRQYLKNEKNGLFWSGFIARELNKHHHNLAIQWVAECIRIRLAESEPSQITKLDEYIQQALDARDISASECNEIARKIWNRREGDFIQTAVARLWWVIGCLKEGNERAGIREIASAVSLVSFDVEFVSLDRVKRKINHRLINQYLESCARIYKEYK